MLVYLSFSVTMFFLPARLDARQGQFLAEDLGEFLHRQIDFEDVPAGLIAGLRLAVAVLRRRERLAGLRRRPTPTPPEPFLP